MICYFMLLSTEEILVLVVVVVVLRICHIGQTKIIFPKPTDKAFADKFRLFIKGM